MAEKHNVVFLSNNAWNAFDIVPILSYGRDSEGKKRLFLQIHGINFFNLTYGLLVGNSIHVEDADHNLTKYSLHRPLHNVAPAGSFQRLANIVASRRNLALYANLGINLDFVYVINCYSGHFDEAVSYTGVRFIPYNNFNGPTILMHGLLTNTGLIPREFIGALHDLNQESMLNSQIHRQINKIYSELFSTGKCMLSKYLTNPVFVDFYLEIVDGDVVLKYRKYIFDRISHRLDKINIENVEKLLHGICIS